MAHANLHLAVGMAVGTATVGWPVVRAWWHQRPLARPLARLWLVTLAVGAWALVPNLVSAAGLTAALHHVSWADVFVGHRALDRRFDQGGLLIGELGLVAQLVMHYTLLVVALRRARHHAERAAAPGHHAAIHSTSL